jgi:anion-transporting  ArsA/GET3 family ATPase
VAVRTGTEERYATQMGELWSVLTLTLAHLDRLAADPEQLDEDESPQGLRRLQYALHVAGERVYGLAPPPGDEPAHCELWAALAGARDATGEIAEALEEDGAEAVEPFVHEWRGALFRVRLARLRLSDPEPASGGPAEMRREFRGPVAALLLVATGAAAFALGATTGHWPLWAAGMLAVSGATLVYRP